MKLGAVSLLFTHTVIQRIHLFHSDLRQCKGLVRVHGEQLSEMG